ncbi:MAG TPA: stringent starvation protein A [Gammaproteobacteria bacterium]|nr:stringent starvation protein A [Gammaproteobacteria bacterium]
MVVIANRRTVMTLFSGGSDIDSHRVRIVLAEKGINVEITEVTSDDLPEDLIDLNPYNTVPTLVDRDLVLFEPAVIMEYLDERFPHPPLMPVDPVSRAQSRLMFYRIKKDWDGLLAKASGSDDKVAAKARKELRDSLTSVAPLFERNPFFLSEEYSLVDCAMAPLLWRLSRAGVTLRPPARPLLEYAERLFGRDGFQRSLSEAEREMGAG